MEAFFIGWDVGAWNCDSNARSRDAIVILDSQCQIVGQPWGWKNNRQQIDRAETADQWIELLFQMCDATPPEQDHHVTIGIDTPLGFSREFLALITTLTKSETPMGGSAANRYLFRETERYLFQRGLSPMSAIKDMIGSQATKGMHTLAKFSPEVESCGVWTDGNHLTAIEAYPAACKNSQTIKSLRKHPPLGREDMEDALTCALVAYLFGTNRELLASPPEGTPEIEGWIWVPQDGLTSECDE